MIISLAKNLDKLGNDICSIKKSVEGFDGRMLIMAVRIIGLQERIDAIEESLHHAKNKKSQIIESWNESKLMDAKLPSSKERESHSLKRTVEYEQALSQFLLRLEEKSKRSLSK
jgi:hypothetical protein